MFDLSPICWIHFEGKKEKGCLFLPSGEQQKSLLTCLCCSLEGEGTERDPMR